MPIPRLTSSVREILAPQNLQHLKANTIFTTQLRPREQSPVSALNMVGVFAVPFQGCSDNVFVKRSSYRSSNKRTNPEDPMIVPGFLMAINHGCSKASGRIDARSSNGNGCKCTMNAANPIESGAKACANQYISIY